MATLYLMVEKEKELRMNFVSNRKCSNFALRFKKNITAEVNT